MARRRYGSSERIEERRQSARDRLHNLMQARMRAGAEESKQREQFVDERERAQDVGWGDDVARGIGLGAGFGPWGAAIGGILGGAKGIRRAQKRRMREGKSGIGALMTTLGDVSATIPSFQSGAQMTRGLQTMQAGRRRRGEGGDNGYANANPYKDAMAQRRASMADVSGDMPAEDDWLREFDEAHRDDWLREFDREHGQSY